MTVHLEGFETWECQIRGTIYVKEMDKPKVTKVRGKGSKLRIKTVDRQLTQERITKKENDPFVNGSLLRIDDDQQKDPETASVNAKTDEELLKILNLKQAARFHKEIDELSEIAIRRLAILAKEADATVNQSESIKKMIWEKWGVDRSSRYDGTWEENSADAKVKELT